MLVDPIRYDMTCHRRVEFADKFAWIGEDWTGATFYLQVRLLPDLSVPPILNLYIGNGLELQYAGTDTIANHIAAGRLAIKVKSVENPATGQNYADGDSVLLSVLLALVTSSGTDTFPPPPEAGEPVVLWYDLVIDRDGAGSGADKQKRFYGTFTVIGTVYRP